MVGFDAMLDQCRFGQRLYANTGDFLGYGKKQAHIRTTKRSLALKIARRCNCPAERPHVPVDSGRALGMQSYTTDLARTLARLIVNDDFEETMPVEEDDEMENLEHRELLKKLREKFDMIIRDISKLHDQFGHPFIPRR